MKKHVFSLLLMLVAAMSISVRANVTIYYDNSVTKWSQVKIHYWSNPGTQWPGDDMEQVDENVWVYTFPSDPSKLGGFLFDEGLNLDQTADYTGAPKANHIYRGNPGKGDVEDLGEYSGGSTIARPVVSANPVSGTRFTDKVSVTLSVNPEATIYYTLDGSAADKNSAVYTAPIELTETTTINTYALTAEGGEASRSFSYTRRSVVVQPEAGKLNTDYYKVNPDGRVGTNRTVNMQFEKVSDNRVCIAKNALNNWTEEDLICQGVARDIASAFRGKHEYPVIDSYAVYAAYDKDNLYLGVQYVYSVWDLYGDGKADNLRAKPYQMDGRIMFAFDLDPEESFEGVLDNGNTIWDADGQYNTFNNGTDCILLCNTKSTVGTPGLFFPNEKGTTSYSAPDCLSIPAPFYGCADGLLPSINHIWGQAEFEYDPAELTGNDGFADLIDEVPADQHTFYEWKLPLSLLGVTEDYIKNTGIGVMVIDTYGQGAIGSTPYDPTVFDNAKTPYSKDPSSSAEKEDKDVFTYGHARIGKLGNSGVESAVIEESADAPVEYYNLQGMRVNNPANGIFIRRQGAKTSKVVL